MKFPHTITLFNKVQNESGEVNYRVTVITGCLNRIVFADNKYDHGTQNGNSTHLYIPLSADTQNKSYISPDKFARLSEEEQSAYYTFSAENDFYAVGEVYFENYGKIKTADVKESANVYKITAAELLQFGSKSLWHWEVTGV